MKKRFFLLSGLILFVLFLMACGHEHAYGAWTQAKAPSCTEAGLSERICSCGEKETKEEPMLAHSFSMPTCTDPAICTECGTELGRKLGHWFTPATCTKPATCTGCGIESGEALGHSFSEAACTAPATCSLCGTTEGEARGHSFADATCTLPATCTACGITEGEANGHHFPNEMTNLCTDIACSRCDAVKAQTHDYQTLTAEPPTLNKTGILTEKCDTCGHGQVTVLPVVDPQTLGMPVISISDYDVSAIPLASLEKKDGSVVVRYRYVSNDDAVDSFDCFCEIKIQGSSSANYPKKNFTVKFYKDAALDGKLKVDLGWGKESKYCMKANYVDSSQARNIVGAKLFAQMVQSRDNVNEGLAAAPNFGVIDGYPVLVYLNGEFYGLYTMNIPKDEWMFGMEGEETDREALLMSDGWTDSNHLKAEIGDSFAASGWEVEYCSSEDDGWIRDSFNELINLINCGDRERIRRELADHLDIDAAIDNMLFTYFINAADNVAKNILWATYDGQIWIPTMYDMDGTFGIFFNGQPVGTDSPRETYAVYPEIAADNSLNIPGIELYRTLIVCFADRVQARWTELRGGILTVENTTAVFDAFFAQIAEVAYVSDQKNWPKVPYFEQNRSNMYQATADHLERLDAFFCHFAEAL